MTTVSGHNIVIQQSGAAQELTQQAHSPKPSPEQAAAQQEDDERVKGSTVQEFDESERLKAKKDRDKKRRKQKLIKKKAKKKSEQEEMEQDPDATGRLLDTTI